MVLEQINVTIDAPSIIERLNRALEQVDTLVAERTDAQRLLDGIAFCDWLVANQFCFATLHRGTLVEASTPHELLVSRWLTEKDRP